MPWQATVVALSPTHGRSIHSRGPSRHNAVNCAVYEALSAVAVGAVLLGDKGAPQATAHLNSTHVLDIAEIGGG
eukprot:scaffold4655_cov115-Isochrysis_galbana.AAC.2